MFPFKKTASVQRNITVPFQIPTHQMTSSKYSFPQLNPDTLVIIDSAVENSDSLLGGIIPNAVTIILNPDQDGIEKITQSLQSLKSVSSLHIISHGAPGWLQLGNSQLSLDTLEQYKKQLHNWSIKRLLLYGCNIAAGDAGTEFIEKLHNLTGAEIAASANLTGSQALGGAWDLEFKTSVFNVELAVTPEAQKSYGFVLGEPVTDFTVSNDSGIDDQPLTFDNNTFTFASGEADQLVVLDFTINEENSQQTFSFPSSFSDFEIRRAFEPGNNDQVQGKKQLVWFDVEDPENGQNANQIAPAFPQNGNLKINGTTATFSDPDDIMRGVLFGLSINSGTDNVFTNSGGNANNIERIDYFNTENSVFVPEDLNSSGILILERAGGSGDPFYIAAITDIDESGQPSAFGTLHEVERGNWGKPKDENLGVVQIQTLILEQEDDGDDNTNEVRLEVSQNRGEQEVAGVFVSLDDLLQPNQELYGYSLFAADLKTENVTTPTDLIDVTNTEIYPRDTDDQNGGLDLIEGGFIYYVDEPPVNTNPVAVDDAETTPVNTPVAVDVLENDSDPEDDPLTITEITTAPANGTATINNNGTPDNPSDDVVDYTPEDGFSGQDTFDYRIEDGNGGSDSATVTITIDEPAPPIPTVPPTLDLDGNDSTTLGSDFATTFITGENPVPGWHKTSSS